MSCRLVANRADRDGGGMYNHARDGVCKPVLTDCTFAANAAYSGGGVYSEGAGGECSPILTRCTFNGNSAQYGGGGCYNNFANAALTECEFKNNASDVGGGGLFNNQSGPYVASSLFTDNTAGSGGGIYNRLNSHSIFVNCLFTANTCNGNGGAIVNEYYSKPSLVNCTFHGNRAGKRGGAITNDDFGELAVANCILWGDAPEEIFNGYVSTITISYSDVEGTWPGLGNISSDPCFVEVGYRDPNGFWVKGDYRLFSGSLCIDAGDEAALPGDALDLDEDGDETEPVPFDLAGSNRLTNWSVDMCCYERPWPTFVTSPESVMVPEGGTAAFTVALDTVPVATVDVTIISVSGDPDIVVDSGALLTFDASNYWQPQPVTLRALEDMDYCDGVTTFAIQGSGFYMTRVEATEVESNPVPSVIYVDWRSPESNWGASWEHAFIDLQSALAVAATYPTIEEVHVGQGIYKPTCSTGDREATFQLVDGLAIRGGYAGLGADDPNFRDIDTHQTILSGDLNGDDALVADPMDLLAEPTRAENSFHVVTGTGTDETAELDGFTITGGNANGSSRNEYGAGLCNFDAGSPTIIRCKITENSAGECGGGVNNYNLCRPRLVNCVITRNTANNGYGGGGIFNSSDSHPQFTSCVVANNRAGYGGGMASRYGCTATLTNCTFVGNTANYGSGIDNREHSQVTATSCIVWANGDGSESSQICGGTPLIDYSCIEGWTGVFAGIGNIGTDPLFLFPYREEAIDVDYSLSPYSPCIDAGDPNCQEHPGETDLAGNYRVVGERIDMGAYESNYIEAALKFTPQALNPTSQGLWVKAHVILPEGFTVEDVDVDRWAYLQPLGITSAMITPYVNDNGLVEIEVPFDRSAFCASGFYGALDVTVVGVLTDGRDYYGTDRIRILDNRLETLATMAAHWTASNCGMPDWCEGADVNQDSVVNLLDFTLPDGCCVETAAP